jgi:outer membrane protein assembly factor BamA
MLRAFLTLRPDGAGGVEIPFHNHAIEADIPEIAKDTRLRMRLEFNRFSASGYYGLGNNAPKRTPWEQIDPAVEPEAYLGARRYQMYDRIYPMLSVGLQWALWRRGERRVDAFLTSHLSYNWINVYSGSVLESDIRAMGQSTREGLALRSLLRGMVPHLLWLVGAGLLWDTRDHEFSPTQGVLHELTLRASPGVDARLAYVSIHLHLRAFFRLYRDILILALRGAGDLIVGDAPFYMLSEMNGFFASPLGVGAWMRSLPTGRYHGKIKMLLSAELRGRFWAFSVGSARFHLGAALFAEAGRIWLDLDELARPFDDLRHSAAWLGLRLAGGGGIRLQWGEALMVRFDVSYSTIDELGVYIGLQHAF